MTEGVHADSDPTPIAVELALTWRQDGSESPTAIWWSSARLSPLSSSHQREQLIPVGQCGRFSTGR